MTCKVQNLTHRIVSIRGNSGQSWHLPPRYSLDLTEDEVADNHKITKLVANGILAVQREEGRQPASTTQEKGRRSKAQHAEGA